MLLNSPLFMRSRISAVAGDASSDHTRRRTASLCFVPALHSAITMEEQSWSETILYALAFVGLITIISLVYIWADKGAVELERRGNMTLCERQVDDMKRAHLNPTRDCAR